MLIDLTIFNIRIFSNMSLKVRLSKQVCCWVLTGLIFSHRIKLFIETTSETDHHLLLTLEWIWQSFVFVPSPVVPYESFLPKLSYITALYKKLYNFWNSSSILKRKMFFNILVTSSKKLSIATRKERSIYFCSIDFKNQQIFRFVY